MGKHSDFIKDIDGDVVLSDEGRIYKMFNPYSVTMAGYRDGFKFHEETYDDMNDFYGEIASILTALKFTKFEMKNYISKCDVTKIKILDFENPTSKIKVRLVLQGFKLDLSDLQDIFNMPV